MVLNTPGMGPFIRVEGDLVYVIVSNMYTPEDATQEEITNLVAERSKHSSFGTYDKTTTINMFPVDTLEDRIDVTVNEMEEEFKAWVVDKEAAMNVLAKSKYKVSQ